MTTNCHNVNFVLIDKPIERQAANYFWEQADYWRRQGDTAYAAKMEARASEWASQSR